MVTIRHLDQLWWPELGIRKRDVFDYYRAVASVGLPHLRDRPFTIKQHYNGPRSPFRWIKDAPPELPDCVAARDRRGILGDTAMNGHGQQIVSVYSVRPRPGAPVATPLRWDELDERLDPRELTMERVVERIERLGDLHEPLLRGRRRLQPALRRL